MQFGRKNDFAIEIGELLQYSGLDSTYCQFRFWFGGQPIGDWEDRIMLLSSAGWMQELIDHRASRLAEPFDDESAETVFMNVYDAYFEQDPATDWPVPDIRIRHHMDSIGMGAIQDKFGIAIVEERSGQQRVIVKDLRTETITVDIRLPEATVEDIGQQYVCWARSYDKPYSHDDPSGRA